VPVPLGSGFRLGGFCLLFRAVTTHSIVRSITRYLIRFLVRKLLNIIGGMSNLGESRNGRKGQSNTLEHFRSPFGWREVRQ
jgi:hypothetical protein